MCVCVCACAHMCGMHLCLQLLIFDRAIGFGKTSISAAIAPE